MISKSFCQSTVNSYTDNVVGTHKIEKKTVAVIFVSLKAI